MAVGLGEVHEAEEMIAMVHEAEMIVMVHEAGEMIAMVHEAGMIVLVHEAEEMIVLAHEAEEMIAMAHEAGTNFLVLLEIVIAPHLVQRDGVVMIALVDLVTVEDSDVILVGDDGITTIDFAEMMRVDDVMRRIDLVTIDVGTTVVAIDEPLKGVGAEHCHKCFSKFLYRNSRSSKSYRRSQSSCNKQLDKSPFSMRARNAALTQLFNYNCRMLLVSVSTEIHSTVCFLSTVLDDNPSP